MEIGGLPHAACRYLASSLVVCFLRIMTLATWCGSDDDGFDGVGDWIVVRETSHKSSVKLRLSVKIILLSL